MLIHYNLSIAYSMCFIYEYNMSFSHFRKKELVLCFQEHNTLPIFAYNGLSARKSTKTYTKRGFHAGFSPCAWSTKKLLVQGALTYFTCSDSRKGVRCLLVNTFSNISSYTRPAMLWLLSCYTLLRVLVLHTRGEFSSYASHRLSAAISQQQQ